MMSFSGAWCMAAILDFWVTLALKKYDVLRTTILSWVRGSWDTRSWVRGSWVRGSWVRGPIVFRLAHLFSFLPHFLSLFGGSEQGFDPFFFVLGAPAHVWVSVPEGDRHRWKLGPGSIEYKYRYFDTLPVSIPVSILVDKNFDTSIPLTTVNLTFLTSLCEVLGWVHAVTMTMRSLIWAPSAIYNLWLRHRTIGINGIVFPPLSLYLPLSLYIFLSLSDSVNLQF